MFYVYVLYDPNDYAVRYVGQTNDPKRRYHEHLSHYKRNRHTCAWVKSLQRQNFNPLMQVIDCSNTEEDINWLESWWIAYGKLCKWRLTNLTSGGKCYRLSNESRALLSKALKGRKFSEDHKQKMRIVASNRTEETLRKMSIAKKGKPLSESHKESIRASMMGEANHFYGKHHTKETREHLRELASGTNNHWYGKSRPEHSAFLKEHAKRGEDNPTSKLTEREVIAIKYMLLEGRTQKEIAGIFGVAQTTIAAINKGKTWKWLTI